jgi:hypothetical protein
MPALQTCVPLHKQIAIQGMLAAGMSYRQIQDDADVAPNTIAAIKRKSIPESMLLDSIKKVLPTAFYALSSMAVMKVTPEKLDACSAPQLMMVAGISVDKARDMEGSNRPVFNIVTVVNECKQTRDKMERQLQMITRAETSLLATSTHTSV